MTRILALTLATVIVGAVWANENWPQFRGPDGDGHSDSQGLPLTWSETKNVRWKTAIHGKAWSSLGRLLDPITQDACAFFEDHTIFDDFTGVVYDTSEGERIARTLGPRKAAILRNHGLLTVGESVDEAVWWFITMDRSCEAQLLAEAAGKPIAIDRENALVTRGQVGTHGAGWFQFQPLWQRISREQPDLFD